MEDESKKEEQERNFKETEISKIVENIKMKGEFFIILTPPEIFTLGSFDKHSPSIMKCYKGP